MTIDQRSQHPAIDISRDGNVIGLRQEVTDGFVTLPEALDLVSVLVEPAATVAMGKNIGVVILERFLGHKCLSFGRFFALSGAEGAVEARVAKEKLSDSAASTSGYALHSTRRLGYGVEDGSGVSVGISVLVAVAVFVAVPVFVGLTVFEGVSVREGVKVGGAVGASPWRRNSPTTFHSSPTKTWT